MNEKHGGGMILSVAMQLQGVARENFVMVISRKYEISKDVVTEFNGKWNSFQVCRNPMHLSEVIYLYLGIHFIE